jgi:YD repeat-containing protein
LQLPFPKTCAPPASPWAPAAADQVARTVYDKDSRAVFYIDALNQVAKSAYDGNGNVIQTTHYAAPIALPATITVASVRSALPAAPGDADRITRCVFDAANRLVYRIDALGYVTQNGYDKDGNLVKTIAYAKAMTVNGNPTLAAMQTTVAANADSAHDRVTRSVFDNANRAVYAIDPNGYVQQYGYDGLRLCEANHPVCRCGHGQGRRHRCRRRRAAAGNRAGHCAG